MLWEEASDYNRRPFYLRYQGSYRNGAMRTQRRLWINQPLFWKGIAAGSMNSFTDPFYSEVHQCHKYRETGHHAPGILILNGMDGHSYQVGR